MGLQNLLTCYQNYMQYQSQRMKILHDKKTGNDKLLTTKSDNILTAWKFLLLIYQFTSNVSCLIDLITTEKKNSANNKLLLQIVN